MLGMMSANDHLAVVDHTHVEFRSFHLPPKQQGALLTRYGDGFIRFGGDRGAVDPSSEVQGVGDEGQEGTGDDDGARDGEGGLGGGSPYPRSSSGGCIGDPGGESVDTLVGSL